MMKERETVVKVKRKSSLSQRNLLKEVKIIKKEQEMVKLKKCQNHRPRKLKKKRK